MPWPQASLAPVNLRSIRDGRTGFAPVLVADVRRSYDQGRSQSNPSRAVPPPERECMFDRAIVLSTVLFAGVTIVTSQTFAAASPAATQPSPKVVRLWEGDAP